MSIELTRPTQIGSGEVLTSGIVGQSSAVSAMGANTVLLTVSGAIRTTDLWGVYLQAGQPSQVMIIDTTGSIVVSGSGLSLNGVATGASTAPQIKNYGSIQVTANGTGTGISLTGPTSGSLNVGTIMVTGSGYGVNLQGAGASDFQNSGSILAVGSTVTGVRLLAETALLINGPTGSIRAFGSVSSVGLYVAADQTVASGGIRNYGLIEGATSIQVAGYNSAAPNLEIINANGAVLRGKFVGSAGSERLSNSGVIEGDVSMGAGADSYNGAGGRVTGIIQGGDGADTLMGGDVFDYLHGNQGDDSLNAAGGDDWVVGGQGNDFMMGGDGADLCLGNLGNDTIDGGNGDDVVRGGQGDDSVSGGPGDDFVAGDRGDDIMVGGPGADRFHSFAEAGTDRVLDFSRAQGDVVNLLTGSTYTVAQVGADVVITVGGTAQLILVGVSLSTLTGDWLTFG